MALLLGYGLLNPYVGLVFGIMLVAIVLARMLGKSSGNKDLEAWASMETSEYVMNAIIFVTMFVVYSALLSVAYAWLNTNSIAGLPSVSSGDITGEQLSLTGAISSKLSHVLYYRLIPMEINLLKTKFLLLLYSGSDKISTGPKSLGYTLPAFPGIGMYIKGLDTLIYLYSMIAPTLAAQVIGLDIIGALAYNLLIPLGILFRFVPFLRSFGNELIAIAIGMGIMMPVAYLLMMRAIDDIEYQHKVPGVLRTDISETEWKLEAEAAYFGTAYVIMAPLAITVGASFAKDILNTVGVGTAFSKLGWIQNLANSPGFKVLSNVGVAAMSWIFSIQMAFAIFSVLIPASHLGAFVIAGLIIPTFAFMLGLSFTTAISKQLNFSISETGVLL
jgi:uncharacterized membrane protein (DUF485 family)